MGVSYFVYIGPCITLTGTKKVDFNIVEWGCENCKKVRSDNFCTKCGGKNGKIVITKSGILKTGDDVLRSFLESVSHDGETHDTAIDVLNGCQYSNHIFTYTDSESDNWFNVDSHYCIPITFDVNFNVEAAIAEFTSIDIVSKLIHFMDENSIPYEVKYNVVPYTG